MKSVLVNSNYNPLVERRLADPGRRTITAMLCRRFPAISDILALALVTSGRL